MRVRVFSMSILVAYASRHGATTDIARRIADRISQSGQYAEARPVGQVTDATTFDGYVVGSAVYLGHWLKEGTRFVRHHRDLLAQRPVWLFSCGPLGTEGSGGDAHAGADAPARPEPKEIDELLAAVRPVDHRVFFGALDPKLLGIRERALRALPPARTSLPAGDFRNWPEIDAWADSIAGEMWQQATPSGEKHL